jgi:hypothetical protein
MGSIHAFPPGVDGGKSPVMQSHEVLRDVLKTTSAKQIASDLGLSLSLVYKWTEQPTSDSTGSNPLDRVDQLLKCTQDLRIIHWLCQRAGGFFIKNPNVHNAHPDYLIPATNEIVQEFADLLAVIATSAADNQINDAEARRIRERWEQLKSVTETFVACCEQGNFRPFKDAAGSEKA